MQRRYRIRFPRIAAHDLDQDETWFFLEEAGKERRIRFHDYAEIYDVPGLYEQLFHDRLQCASPAKVTEILRSAVAQSSDSFTELRVFDPGAGNGMMGEALKKYGVARMVGVDIIAEARAAVERDRPGLYDAYYVDDFTNLAAETREEIASWRFDCMVTVAALGFGDIPTAAFIEAFNIKDTFEGEPLYYFAMAGRKNADVPCSFLESRDLLA